MKTRLKWLMVGVGVLGLTAVAMAREGHVGAGKHAWMEARVNAHIDDALEAIKANPQQRAAVYAARDHLVEAFKAGHGDRVNALREASELFSSDRLDEKRIAAARARHEAEAQKIGDAVVQAFYDVHDALTSAQRKSLVEYARNELPRAGKGGWQMRLMTAMVDSRIDEALTELKATPDQRAKIVAAKERVVTAFTAQHEGRHQKLEQILDLFAADKIDAAKVKELRAEHITEMRKLGDVVAQAVTELHNTLDAGQRKQLVELVKTQAQRHHHGG